MYKEELRNKEWAWPRDNEWRLLNISGRWRCWSAAAAAKSLQSCPTLYDPIDCSPPSSPVPGALQARTLEWLAIFFSNAWKRKVKVKSLSHVWLLATPWTAAYQESCVHGIFQARVLEWGAIAFSEKWPKSLFIIRKKIIYETTHSDTSILFTAIEITPEEVS